MFDTTNTMGISMPTSIPPMGGNMFGVTPTYGAPAYNLPQFPQGNQQFANDQTIKINPAVMALVNPIIELMTQYEMFKKSNAAFGMWDPKNSLSDFEKNRFDTAKKRCVHLIRDIQSGQLVPTLEEVDDTKFRCRLCEREIYKKFDKSAVDKLKDGIAVLNMLAFFGMTLNITPEHMSKIIFLKETIPDAIQLVDILNNFVKEEDSTISSGANIGEASRNAEFRTGSMLGFGGF